MAAEDPLGHWRCFHAPMHPCDSEDSWCRPNQLQAACPPREIPTGLHFGVVHLHCSVMLPEVAFKAISDAFVEGLVASIHRIGFYENSPGQFSIYPSECLEPHTHSGTGTAYK